MLPAPSRSSCAPHGSNSSRQSLAGTRPLRALRQLHPHTRPPPPSPRAGGTACAATAAKAPELSPQEQQLLQCALNYEYTVDLPEGQLVISPLRERWQQRTGDLLADTFVDAKGIQPYRRYVRRNIGKYLDQHINMPPAAVVVTAVLRTQVEGSPSTDLGLHDLQPPTAAPAAAGPSSSSNSSNSNSDAADGEPQPGDHPLTQFLLRYLGWLVKPNTHVELSGSSSSSSSLSTADEAGRTYTDSTADSRSSSSSSPVDAHAAVTAIGASSSSTTASASTSSSGGGGGGGGSAQDASSTGKAHSRNVAELVGSALQRLSDSVSLPALRLQHKANQTHVVETLVGVAEVSFRERTRSQALTLNPPQKCAYLCNMAVAKEWRRRGVASELMTAIEDMCLLAGEADLYLHLRFKDEATAGSLYRKHGFNSAKKDCWLLLLLGQEPRFLMLKQLAADRMLAGQVQLPGFKQGVTAAELQQEQQAQLQQQDAAAGVGQEGAGEGRAAAAPAASPTA